MKQRIIGLLFIAILGGFIAINAKCVPEEAIEQPLMINVEPIPATKEPVNVIKTSENVIKTSENVIKEPEIEEWCSLGEFKLTAYCACEKCCGKCDGITATGTHAIQGRTIAVDPNVIPYGSCVKIGDHEYIAEDCGGAIKENRIDVYFDSHQDALVFGVQYEEVFIKNERVD